MVWVLAAMLVLVGIAGTVLPVLPGAPLVFLGLVLAAWIDGFQRVGWLTLALLAALTLASVGVDFVAMSLGAKRVGASRQAVIGAAIGTVAGLFFGLPGILAGPFVGAAAGEYLARRDAIQAGRVGLGTWLGLALGAAAKLALAFAMLGLFVTAYIL